MVLHEKGINYDFMFKKTDSQLSLAVFLYQFYHLPAQGFVPQTPF